jgi:hypothetical protein
MPKLDLGLPGVPDQKAFEIGLSLIPTPAEYNFTIHNHYLSLALFLWTCLRSQIDGVGYVPCGTTTRGRYDDELLEHASAFLHKLGWNGREENLKNDRSKVVFRLYRDLSRKAALRPEDRCYIPTPEQLMHMKLPQNEGLLFVLWLFVLAILEGRNTIHLGQPPVLWMTDTVKQKAISIISHRGWSVQAEIGRRQGKKDVWLRFVPSGRVITHRRIV